MNDWQSIKVLSEDIAQIYAPLHRMGAVGDTCEAGFSRAAYSDEETAAMRHIEALALAGGLQCRWDAVGNLIVELTGEYSQWIETGSHMDTVPAGGNYDGTAGVVAGLALLLAVQRAAITMKQGLRLRVWRGEESSTFGVVSIGSRAAFGLLPASSLEHGYQGSSLAEAMRSQGADAEYVRQGKPSISLDEQDSIAAYMELHIEQGSVLEVEAKDVGVVTGIRGSTRSWVVLHGAFDHSGATPMGRDFRRDVNLTMAYMQVGLDQLLNQALEDGLDLVQTVGVINSSHDMSVNLPHVQLNAVAKVSGCGYFSHEVRGCSAEVVEDFTVKAYALMRQVAASHGVELEIQTFSKISGVKALDHRLQGLLCTVCDQQRVRYRSLASGAWHDAAVVCGVSHSDGSAIPVGMLFIPCRGGVSHSPDQYVSDVQVAVGATVLLQAMVCLAEEGSS